MVIRPSQLRLLLSYVLALSLSHACLAADDAAPAAESYLSSNTATRDSVESAASPSIISDVALTEQHTLVLNIVDSRGAATGNVPVRIEFQGHVIASAASDAQGRVTISGLRPGIHTVVTGPRPVFYRLWTADTAPPASLRSPAIIADGELTRGQYGPMMAYPMQPMMGPPMMAPGMVAAGVTAIAVAAVVIGKNSSSDPTPVATPASP